MLPWDDRRNVETGSRAGVWDWRSVLCDVAQLSRMLEFPDTDCLNCFLNVGKICMFGECIPALIAWVRSGDGCSIAAYCVLPVGCLIRSRKGPVVRGCAGSGCFPG